MLRKRIFTTAILTAISISIAPITVAQDAKLYDNRFESRTKLKHSLNCSIQERVSLKVIAGIKRSKKVSDSKRKKFAIKAAVRAVESGFNYAIMDPVTLTERADTQDVIRYGWGTARRDSVTTARYLSYYQACQIVDDELAFDIMFNPDTKARFSNAGGLVDLRQFIKTLGDGSELSNVGPAQPMLAPKRFVFPGDRERLLSQHPVKTEAMRCLTNFRSVSLQNFRSIPAENGTCLDNLRDQARAVKWDKFPPFMADKRAAKGDRGYIVRGRPTSGGAPQSSQFKLTGKWENLGADFPKFDGSIFKYNDTYFIGSNTVSEDEMLDYAVFISAKKHLRKLKAIVTVESYTDELQLSYQKKYASELKKAKINAQRSRLVEPTTLPKHGVSESKYLFSPEIDRVKFRMVETYENLLVLGLLQNSGCLDKHFICADRLEAYNALGPKLLGPSFQQISAPPRYKPYEP